MKKQIKIVILSIFIGVALSFNVNAESQSDVVNQKSARDEQTKTYEIWVKGYTTTSVNVRKKPNKKAKVLNTYEINTPIIFIKCQKKKNWYKIKYKKNKYAYIYKKYVSRKKAKEYTWKGPKLTKSSGVAYGPSGKETYYNMNMSGVVSIMRKMGNKDKYWIREDGVKMLGNYVMVAADLKKHKRGSHVPTTLGMGVVCDTGEFVKINSCQLDVAVAW